MQQLRLLSSRIVLYRKQMRRRNKYQQVNITFLLDFFLHSPLFKLQVGNSSLQASICYLNLKQCCLQICYWMRYQLIRECANATAIMTTSITTRKGCFFATTKPLCSTYFLSIK
ncbi:unnamed protein product [Paramecium primaurelia]|uniref:Uncharacterized protein n=1 Tax=Paramecium primaurelia TaxID=5886 RepID=A0A8S1Q2N1_PARPR|nr:unnamed protein product [Paramecium primaurelia]